MLPEGGKNQKTMYKPVKAIEVRIWGKLLGGLVKVKGLPSPGVRILTPETRMSGGTKVSMLKNLMLFQTINKGKGAQKVQGSVCRLRCSLDSITACIDNLVC